MVYVISGGPGFGKTTLVNELGRMGYSICPEEARELLNRAMVFPGDFEKRVASLRLKFLLSTSPETIAFADRGLPDQIAYSWYKNRQPSNFIEELVTSNKYAPQVFLTPPWENIFSNDEIRLESFDEACQIHQHIIQAYSKFGYQTVDLPLTSPGLRAEFILNFLGI